MVLAKFRAVKNFRLSMRWLLSASVVLLLPVLAKAQPRGKQRQHSGEAAPALKAQALREGGPDVIMLIVEGLSAEHLDSGRLATDAPDLSKWVNLGVRFTQAYFPSREDGTARVSLLTGVPPWESGVSDDAFDWQKAAPLKNKPSLPEYFRQGGFLTAGAGKTFPIPQNVASDAVRARESMLTEGVWDVRFASDAGSVTERNQELMEWTSTFLSKERELPYFLVLGLEQGQQVTETVVSTNNLCGRILQDLESRGGLGKTILLLVGTPDRSQKLGAGAGVALSMYVPDKTAAASQVLSLVSVLDVYPTLCEAVGEMKSPDYLIGKSLLGSASSESVPLVFSQGRGESASVVVRSDKWLYERNDSGGEHLYDLSADATMMRNLAESAELTQIKQSLQNAVPTQWATFSRSMEEVIYDSSADGTIVYELRAGDTFKAEEGPDLKGRGLDIQMVFNYNSSQDGNATLISVGDERTGFAIHLVDGEPWFTVKYEALCTSLRMGSKLDDGQVMLHGLLGLDNGLHLAAVGVGEAHGYTPMEGGFTDSLKGVFTVGQRGAVLTGEKFKTQTDLRGEMKHFTLALLPGTTAETRAVKAVPVE